MSFATVDAVKTYLNKEALTVEQTATISALTVLIDGVIQNYCGWNMLAKDYTAKKFNGNGDTELDLGVYPINSVTEVKIYDDLTYTDFTDYTTEIIAAEDEGVLLFKDGSTVFTAGRRNVAVTFNAGFTEEAMPEDLKYAASYLVALEYTKIDKEIIGVAEQKFNNLEEKLDGNDLPVLVKRVLDRYRKILVL